MSHGVTRLKELLFDAESQTLSALQQRVENLASSSNADRDTLRREISALAEREAGLRVSLSQRLDEVFEKAGTLERFQTSVAKVIDKSLRDAEVDRHAQLSSAIAPLVTRTIKTEIHNSRDELVEALYPMTGRMVQAYVASALKDLTNEINRRIGQNPAMLRMRALMTGRSVAELAIADTQKLELEELYLIRRGSGELIARWPQTDISGVGSNRDQVMSGILTAINEFASEALSGPGSELRQIDLGSDEVYLRASPSHLLAAKCSGTAHASIEKLIDAEFLKCIEGQLGSGAATSSPLPQAAHATQLSALAENLQTRIADEQERLRSSGFNPAKLLFWLVGLIAAGLIAWWAWAELTEYRVRTLANEVIDTSRDLRGYPIRLTIAPYGEALTVAGLTPTRVARDDLLERLRLALPGVIIRDGLSAVPSGDATLEPEVARLRSELSGLEAKLARDRIAGSTLTALQRLAGLAPDLDRLSTALPEGNRSQAAETVLGISSSVEASSDELRTASQMARGTAPFEAVFSKLEAITKRLNRAANDAQSMVDARAPAREPNIIPSAVAGTPLAPERRAARQSEAMALEAERLATLILAANQAAALVPPPPELPAKSERERLEDFIGANAIFFSNDTEYRDSTAARAALDELSNLMRGGTLLVRVVGFTDEQGDIDANRRLARARARTVYDDLLRRGVPARRLVAVGRGLGRDLSAAVGALSPNRRVQFEIGFIGEASQ